MSESRPGAIKSRLIQLREELLGEIRQKNAEVADLNENAGGDSGDLSAADTLREFLHLLSDNKRQELVRIDDALDRIERGDYGLCLDCDEPIDAQRLQVRPYTRYCISCKEDLEAMRRP